MSSTESQNHHHGRTANLVPSYLGLVKIYACVLRNDYLKQAFVASTPYLDNRPGSLQTRASGHDFMARNKVPAPSLRKHQLPRLARPVFPPCDSKAWLPDTCSGQANTASRRGVAAHGTRELLVSSTYSVLIEQGCASFKDSPTLAQDRRQVTATHSSAGDISLQPKTAGSAPLTLPEWHLRRSMVDGMTIGLGRLTGDQHRSLETLEDHYQQWQVRLYKSTSDSNPTFMNIRSSSSVPEE